MTKTEVRKLRHNPYFKYLLLQILMLPTIIAIFKYIPDRKIAALFAGSLFIAICLGTFRNEYMRVRFHAKFFWWSGLQFFILFALPIVLLRLFYWEQPFGQIAVGPIRASALHELSNKSYIIWMIGTLIEGLLWFRLLNKKPE